MNLFKVLMMVLIMNNLKIKFMKKSSNSNLKLAAAVLVGAAVGGAIGILFAPEKGSDTRDIILAKGEDLSDAMKDKFQTIVDEVKKELGQVKVKARVIIGDGLAKAESFNSEGQLL
jgi:gas vesicle protein